MPSDSNDVNRALLARLGGDAGLTTIVGANAVYMNLVPANMTKYVLITQRTHTDEPMQNATAFEVFTFIVQAIVQGSSATPAAQAAQRIFELLHLQEMAITGYALMLMKRIEHVNYPDRDEFSKDWQHRGGVYELWVQPTAA